MQWGHFDIIYDRKLMIVYQLVLRSYFAVSNFSVMHKLYRTVPYMQEASISALLYLIDKFFFFVFNISMMF